MIEGGWDAVAMLDGEVKAAAAGRVAVGDNKTVKTKLHLVWIRSETAAGDKSVITCKRKILTRWF